MRSLKLILLILFSITGFSARSQNWEMVTTGQEPVDILSVDSITYTKGIGYIYEYLWNSGEVTSVRIPMHGDEITFRKIEHSYKYSVAEEDGVDAIITDNDLYAILKPLDNGEFLYLDGVAGSPYSEQMLFDKNGLLKALYVEGVGSLGVFYTEQELIMYDESGDIYLEIPYSEIVIDESESDNNIATRASILTRNPIYKALRLKQTLMDLIKQPIGSTAKTLLQYAISAEGGRYGDMINDFVDLAMDITDPLSWIQILDHMQEIFFFGDTSIHTLPAETVNITNYELSCEITGPSSSASIFDNPNILINDCSVTVKMSLRPDSYISGDGIQTKECQIDSDGVKSFLFDVKDLETLYYFEPSLTLNVKSELITSYPIFDLLYIPSTVNIPLVIPFNVGCTIYGEELGFITGSVSSRVVDIINIKNTEADIVCNFSECPEGAECQILISRDGSDSAIIFNGRQNEDQQIVKVSGLVPLTSYTVESRIVYQDVPYYSNSNLWFTTTGPSGGVLDVAYDKITTNSAVIKCQFHGIDENSECGIIIEDEEGQRLTISVSSTDEEQDVLVSGLTEGTFYNCRGFVKLNHPNGIYYHEDENVLYFKTKHKSIPDLSGTWTFSQSILGNKIVYPELELTDSGDGYALYEASGFYGVIYLSMTVSSDGSATIVVGSYNGPSGYFSGKFNDDFTSISGSSYTYDFGPNNWAVPPAVFDEPWTLSR